MVASLPSGRLDADTTFSCTKASAGTATNIVPGEALVEGEVRSFGNGVAEGLLARLGSEAERIAGEMGGRAEVFSEALFPPYRVSPDDPMVQHLLQSAAGEGWRGFLHRSGGGSDANHLNAIGIPAVNIGVGYRNPHSRDETLILSEFEGTRAWILHFLRALDAGMP